MKKNDLLDRTFKFGVDCILFLRKMPNNQEYYVIKKLDDKESSQLDDLLKESQELKNILGSIVVKTS